MLYILQDVSIKVSNFISVHLTSKWTQGQKREGLSSYILINTVYLWGFFLSAFSPQTPPTQLYILVVGPSSCSCGVWDAASAWPDEWCHVRAQDPN